MKKIGWNAVKDQLGHFVNPVIIMELFGIILMLEWVIQLAVNAQIVNSYGFS